MAWLRAILCLTILESAALAQGQVPPPPTTLEPAAVEDYVSNYVRSRGIVGLSVAIARDGAVVWSGTFGKSSIETGAPVTADTDFSIGSVTKQFTAACILLLAQDGKLSVHDKVKRWYPNLTRAQDITLLDLMNHVSGYPDYYPLDFVDSRMETPISADDLIARYAGGKLDFEPGTKWSYSNTGFVILGRVVEKVSGQKLGQFMTERILRPVGMDHSFFGPALGKDMAEGCTRFALGPQGRARPEAQGWLDGAAGLNCTALDLVKWDMALMGGRVLNAESYALMTRPRMLADGRIHDYGCGVGVKTISHAIELTHEGAVSGFQTWNVAVPAARSALVILSDCEEWGAVNQLKTTLANLIMPAPETPWVPAIAGVDAGQAALGVYESLRQDRIDRSQLGDEFSRFLTKDKVRDASVRFKKLGPAQRAEVQDRSERGGMEVADVRLVTSDGAISALIYRTPDGKIQECLFQPTY